MKKANENKKSLPYLKRRLMAALAMLMVALILTVTTTYAWLVLSTAPEVTGISTNIGANGSLEIALLNTDTRNDMSSIRTAVVGESLANNRISANEAWGNLIDLSDSSYGLDNLVLLPARLNATAKENGGYVINGGLLSAPTYGYDGRVISVSEDTITAIYKKNRNGFFKNGALQDYGVRAIGTSDNLTVQGSALATVKGNITANISAAQNAAISSVGDDLFSLLLKASGDSATFTNADVAVITTMLGYLQNAEGYIEAALRQGLVAVAASQIGDAPLFEAAYDTIMGTGKSLTTLLDELDGAITDNVPEVFKTWVQEHAKLENDIAAAYAKCTALDDDDHTAGEIKDALSMLMDTSKIYIGEDLLENADTTALMNQFLGGGEISLTLAPGSGVYATIADFTGNYTTWINNKVNMKTASIVDPAYLSALYTVVSGLTAAGGDGENAADFELNVTYGYALDLAFRCNAETSELLLQTLPAQRVFDDSESNATMGGGSYMEFDTTGTDYTPKEILDLMNAMRVAFVDAQNNLLGVARLNVSNRVSDGNKTQAPLYLYEYKIGTEGDELGVLLMDERRKTDTTIVALEKDVPTHITAMVWLDGDLVDNTMVPNTIENAPVGMLNLQFASSADLTPAGDKALEEYEISKIGLSSVIMEANAKVTAGQGLYTTLSWSALTKAVANAQAVLEDTEATQNEITRAITRLNNAIAGLEEVNQATLVEKVKAVRAKLGTTTDIHSIVVPDGKGYAVLTDNYTQEQFDNALGVIYRVDYNKNLNDEGNGVMTPIYTDESWSMYATALYEAEILYYGSKAEEKPGTLAWDTAITALEYAKESLVRNVYYEAYDYNGTMYYMAISNETDTYGKWYTNDFKRVISDLMIINLDAYATRVEIAEFVMDKYVSNLDTLDPGINLLDEIYPNLRDDSIIAADWNLPSVFEKAVTADEIAQLGERVQIAKDLGLESTVWASANLMFNKYSYEYQFGPISQVDYLNVLTALNTAIEAKLNEGVTPPEAPVPLITANQRVVLAKAILEAKSIEGFTPPAEPDPENPEDSKLPALRDAVTAAEALTDESTEAEAQAAIGALNRQLVAFDKNVVTEYNTITYPLPSGADTFEVEYDRTYPDMYPLYVDTSSGTYEITGVLLTKDGVISKISDSVTVYAPADDVNLPWDVDVIPEGGGTSSGVWNGRMYDHVQVQLRQPELEGWIRVPAFNEDGSLKRHEEYGYVIDENYDRYFNEEIASVTWSSSDTDILTVDQNGLVTPTGAGTAEIWVQVKTVQGNTYSDYIEITTRYVPADGIELNQETHNMRVGESRQISVTLIGDGHTETIKSITYSCFLDNVARVSDTGSVRAIGGGSAIVEVTVTTNHGHVYTAEVRVNVSDE